MHVTLKYKKVGTRNIPKDHSSSATLNVFSSGEELSQDGESHISVSLNQTQGQDLSTISPAVIFESMFQNSDDTAIQEDPQQTGLLHKTLFLLISQP